MYMELCIHKSVLQIRGSKWYFIKDVLKTSIEIATIYKRV